MTGPPPIPPEAQEQDALNLVLQAAGHGLQGDAAIYLGSVYSGQPTSLQDRSLITQSQEQTWRRSWLLFVDGANAGVERFVQAADGGQGILRWQPPLDFPLAQGDRFVLFRDYRFGQWLAWLNETARNVHFPQDVYVPFDKDNSLRYAVPAPIKRAGWIEEVLLGPADAVYDPDNPNATPEARSVRWFHVNPKSVGGDLYLQLARPISASQQILFRARIPFAYETGRPYQNLHDVLWPAGQDPAVDPAVVPPVRLFVLGTVWRSLQQKVTNLTGQPRALWQQNLERCARQYAQACAEWGPRPASRQLGYQDDWYPWNTVSWSTP